MMHRRPIGSWLTASLITAGLALLWACGPSPDEVNEIKNQQKQILAKLGEIEKKLDQAATKPAPQRRRSGPEPTTEYALPVEGSAIKGPKDAPATITVFSDYQCPFCARVEPLIADVLKEYPTQVRYVFKNFPLSFHKQAMPAALAAVAAGKQGKFWEMHDKIFANAKALQDDKIREYATGVGLDMEKFEADWKSPEVQKQVQADMALARKVGVRGTPTIFVNGKLLQNRSLDGFKQMIDPILKEKG